MHFLHGFRNARLGRRNRHSPLVCQQHRRFRFDLRYRALLGCSRRQLEDQLLQELRALAAEGVIGPASGLADWLEALAMEPADFYGIRGTGCTPSPGGAPQPRHRRPIHRPSPSASGASG